MESKSRARTNEFKLLIFLDFHVAHDHSLLALLSQCPHHDSHHHRNAHQYRYFWAEVGALQQH